MDGAEDTEGAEDWSATDGAEETEGATDWSPIDGAEETEGASDWSTADGADDTEGAELSPPTLVGDALSDGAVVGASLSSPVGAELVVGTILKDGIFVGTSLCSPSVGARETVGENVRVTTTVGRAVPVGRPV